MGEPLGTSWRVQHGAEPGCGVAAGSAVEDGFLGQSGVGRRRRRELIRHPGSVPPAHPGNPKWLNAGVHGAWS
jgi:hypothetical protein